MGEMKRPTVALACIMKNEAHNLTPMLQSVRGCVDEIQLTDTGSTDTTLEFISKINQKIRECDPEWSGLPEIQVTLFDWVDDFAAARNFNFSQVKSDYVLWLDLDDCLSNKDEFIKWRDTVMNTAHFWLATYNYAFNPQGGVECQFVRERVIKNNHGFKWNYFIHEGLIQEEGLRFWPQKVSTWWVDHKRTDADRKVDHMRNIKIIEKHDYKALPTRLKYYYGKELLENGMPDKAGPALMEALKAKDLDIHDRLLCFQYAIQSLIHAKDYPSAIHLAYSGIEIQPNRAEFWCLLGDIYREQGDLEKALHAYKFAFECKQNNLGGLIVNYSMAYGHYPAVHLVNLHMQLGQIVETEFYINWLKSVDLNTANQLEVQLEKLKDANVIRKDLPVVTDVIITCPPGAMVKDWDENGMKLHGYGGSETAAIEVAKWIKKKTNRKVKIFHDRNKREVMPSGVEYLPLSELQGYIQNVEPAAHLAWRHAVRLTHAKSMVWHHDIITAGIENTTQYDSILCLSPFHKNYLHQIKGVPLDKMQVFFNGVNPEDFELAKAATKDPLKIIFSSSPDRGMRQAIEIVKKARERTSLDFKLHLFYGFSNLEKSGHSDLVNDCLKAIDDNKHFVTYHGMVKKPELMKHMKESAIWLYPSDFIETYCITAIEALSCGTYPLTRQIGALPDTLAPAIERGLVTLLDQQIFKDSDLQIWTDELIKVWKNKAWEKIDYKPEDFSWEKCADFLIREFGL